MGFLKVDEYIWRVERYLMYRYGVDTAQRDTEPLRWYIRTGRASAMFLRLLTDAKPYMIGRLLHQGGSIDETVKRVRMYIGIDVS